MKFSLHVDQVPETLHEFDLPLVPASDPKVYRDGGFLDFGFGNGNFKQYNLNGIFVLGGGFSFNDDLRIRGKADEDLVEMSFHLKGTVSGKMDDFGEEVVMEENQQNLCYVPSKSGVFNFRGKQNYQNFEVHFTKDYFEQLAVRYPDLLADFYEKVVRREPAMLADTNLPITPEMRLIIHELLNQPLDRNLQRIFIEAKVLELLALQVEQAQNTPVIKAKSFINNTKDLNKIHEAKEILVARADNPPTIYELAKMVGTNDFKLKKGFKEVFNNTIFGFLLDFKMEKARNLLRETDKPTSEIAHLLGYSHPGHFTNAFKKKYGITPSAIRSI
ncbi:MAG TPA: hypothetical protein DCS93_35260 [Microscillaceae bacterium]|nr:hypothetical protein [Microscillaceae bacterium]